MCILVAARDAADGSLWVAANRDELLLRPWRPPTLLADEPPVFGGVDVIAGGSWLALNLDAGFVVGITNARRGALPGARSRGRLVLDLASQADLPRAVALLTELDLTCYGAFNVLLADVAGAWLASNAPATVSRIESAVIALGNDSLNEPGERVRVAAEVAASAVTRPAGDRAAALGALLRDHTGEDPLCRHGTAFGTVCSTILRLTPAGPDRYLFAPGPPCVTAYSPLALPGSEPAASDVS